VLEEDRKQCIYEGNVTEITNVKPWLEGDESVFEILQDLVLVFQFCD
jgi:hypothetical protein